MLRFTQEQFDSLRRDVFTDHLEARISQQEEQVVVLPQETRAQLWSFAQDLERHGIASIRGCLVVCHLVWELGLDVFDRIPAFGMVLRDADAAEADKVEALWLLRTQLLAALEGPME